MARSTMINIARSAIRNASPLSRRSLTRLLTIRKSAAPSIYQSSKISSILGVKAFSTSITAYKGISPEAENPQPKEAEANHQPTSATELSTEQYHELSDVYMDTMVAKLEELQEQRADVDVEFSAGVLTLAFPPLGTYVINKQPPNKQIWFSSPISGPKRFDYVVAGEAQSEKEGGGSGDWVYLRDGTSLGEILHKEVGVDLSAEKI